MKRFLVYFFGTGDRVKIGFTAGNLYRRYNQIQLGCPQPIRLIGVILCKDKSEMVNLEGELKRRFKKRQVIREWFRFTPDISAYISELSESGEDILKEDCHSLREYGRIKGREYRQRADADVKERNREYDREYNQRPEIKKRSRDRKRERYHNEPEYRENRLKTEHERYHNNPEYRAKAMKRSRVFYLSNGEKCRKKSREYHARKKREKQSINGQQLQLF